MRSKTITYQSSKIFYRTVGKGKPVVLIHGFGEDGNIWDKQVEFLKDRFQLIIPDLPGTGKSELVKDADIETYSEIIKEVITRELKFPLQGAEGVCILGHSLGGYITLAFAEKFPQFLSCFGLIHSSAFADSAEKKAARIKSIDFIKKNGAYEFLRATIRGLFSEYWSKDHEPEIEALIEKSKNFSAEAIIQYYQAMISRPDRTQVLKNFSNPILYIMGELDNAVPFQLSLQQCYLPQLAHVHVLRNSAHMGMWEETDKVNKAILQFK